MKVKKGSAIPKTVIRLPRSAGISRQRAMAIYRSQVRKLNAARQPVQFNRFNVVIGTNESWANAQSIERNPVWVPVDNANYVWSARDLTSQTAIIARRFVLNPRRPIRAGSLFLSVDNYAVVLINGRIVVFDAPQNTPAFFTQGRTFNIRQYLRRGVNDIVIVAFNFDGPRSPNNPAGVAARLNIRLGSIL